MRELKVKIQEMLAREGIAGCAALLTDRGGIVWSRGFGTRDIACADAPVTADSMFRIASITKVVTGLLIMRLVEEGRIDLDRPVRDYLSWFTLKDESAASVITLRHLMSHRSGLPAEYTPEGPLDEGELVPSLKAGLPTLDLVNAPNDGYKYSNWGIRTASAVLEAVTGRRYSALAREYVLSPLGMDKSTFFLSEAQAYPIALPHTKDESGALLSSSYIKENHARLAAGGIFSSARELSALARLILRGGVADDGTRVVNSASLEAMMTPLTVHDTGNMYGLTMQLHPLPCGRLTYGHYGNADPYTSALMTDPVSGFGAVVLLNTYSKDLRARIADAILEYVIK